MNTMSLRRRSRLAGVAALLVAAVSAAGCAGGGGAVSAVSAPALAGPKRLWSDRPVMPPPSPEPVQPAEEPVRLRGIPGAAAGIRAVNPADVVAADYRAQRPPEDSYEPGAAVVSKIRGCTAGKPDCPLRAPVYQDLTGDGEEELILAVDASPGTLTLRVYALLDGVVTRVLNAVHSPFSVEVAGRDLIVREPIASQGGYEVRTVYSWDAGTRTLVQRTAEVRQVPAGSPGARR
ncbi:lipoprotein [Streptomyces sp. NBRC 110611]|nr:lipoprotein [Streptomyces sp. NBRC 110611]